MTDRGNGLSERLVDYTLGLSYESLPPEVVDRTKQLLLDFLGVALGGRVFAEASGPVLQGAKDLLNGQRGPCTVVGETEKLPAHFAALLNGTFAHAMDFDDTHRDAIMHPGTPIFSTLMALCEENGTTGREFLTAAVAAYDVANKIGRAVGEGVHKRGLHPTATTGIFAATAGGARLIGQGHDQAQNALGINVSQAVGSQQFLESGGWNKPLQVGLAAHNAVYALTMARHGFLGAPHPLEGRFGYFFSYTADGWDPDKICGLGTDFEVMATGLKPYPCCRYNHGVIDAVVGLVREHGLALEEISSLDVYMSPLGHNLVGEPVDLKRNPATVVEGQFSSYFTSAVAALDGCYNWQSYEKLEDPVIRDLMAVTTSHPTEEMRGMARRVTIAMKGGQEFSKDVPLAKGEPENPMTWQEVIAKFTSLAQGSLGQSGAKRVVQAVRGVEQVEDLSKFTALLRP